MSDATIRKPRSQQELREAAIEFWHRVATPGQTGLVLVDVLHELDCPMLVEPTALCVCEVEFVMRKVEV